MGRFFLGFLVPFLLVIVLVLGVWLADLLGIIQLNRLVLETASIFPGLENVATEVELGKKRSKVLQEKEGELRILEHKLKTSKTKLEQEIANFDAEKLKWEQLHLDQNPEQNPSVKKADKKTAEVGDSDLQKYLKVVGGMKPDKAAAVIQKLPDDTALLLFKQLRTSQAAKIMENLPAEYVAELMGKSLNQ